MSLPMNSIIPRAATPSPFPPPLTVSFPRSRAGWPLRQGLLEGAPRVLGRGELQEPVEREEGPLAGREAPVRAWARPREGELDMGAVLEEALYDGLRDNLRRGGTVAATASCLVGATGCVAGVAVVATRDPRRVRLELADPQRARGVEHVEGCIRVEDRLQDCAIDAGRAAARLVGRQVRKEAVRSKDAASARAKPAARLQASVSLVVGTRLCIGRCGRVTGAACTPTAATHTGGRGQPRGSRRGHHHRCRCGRRRSGGGRRGRGCRHHRSRSRRRCRTCLAGAGRRSGGACTRDFLDRGSLPAVMAPAVSPVNADAALALEAVLSALGLGGAGKFEEGVARAARRPRADQADLGRRRASENQNGSTDEKHQWMQGPLWSRPKYCCEWCAVRCHSLLCMLVTKLFLGAGARGSDASPRIPARNACREGPATR